MTTPTPRTEEKPIKSLPNQEPVEREWINDFLTYPGATMAQVVFIDTLEKKAYQKGLQDQLDYQKSVDNVPLPTKSELSTCNICGILRATNELIGGLCINGEAHDYTPKDLEQKNANNLCTNCGAVLSNLVLCSPTTDPKKRQLCIACARSMWSGAMIAAVRYALGRKTYIVSQVVNCVVNNWKLLGNWDRRMIQRDISEAILHNQAGFDTDIDQWERILKL